MADNLPALPAPNSLTTPEGRLAALDARSAVYLEDERPKNTIDAYAGDWRVWQKYATELGIPVDSHTSGALVGFVRWLELREAAPASVDRRLAGVVVTLRRAGVEPSKQSTKDARDALNIYRVRLAKAAEERGRGKAMPTTVKHLRAIAAACPDTLAGHRDRALVLLGFAVAGRRSEIGFLDVADVVEWEEGLTVRIRFGKTGARSVAVPHGTHESTCPVRAWRAWLDASGITTGPALRRIDRHGRILGRLSGHGVADIITRAGRRAGIAIRFTGHSVRAGLATESRRAGHDPKTISQTTGHSPTSRVLYDYMRVVDQWSDNALTGIGL